MTGLLMFLMVKIWSDIAFIIIVAVHFTQNLSYTYTKAMKAIFCYMKRSINYDITYNNEKKLLIKSYLDFNWADNKKSCKLLLGFIFIFNRSLVS